MTSISEAQPRENSHFPEAFAKTEFQMKRAFHQLADVTDLKSIDLVIGDEYSGRLPTFVAVNTLRMLNGNSAPKGILVKPLVRSFEFMTDNDWNKSFEETTRRIIDKTEGINYENALIVTDYVDTGKTLAVFAKSLANLGIDFNVLAALCVPGKDVQLNSMLGKYNANFIAGELSFAGHIDGNMQVTHNYELLGLPEFSNRLARAKNMVLSKENATQTKQEVLRIAQNIASSLKSK